MSELRSETYPSPIDKQIGDLIERVEYGLFVKYPPAFELSYVAGSCSLSYSGIPVADIEPDSADSMEAEIAIDEADLDMEMELDALVDTVQDELISSFTAEEREALKDRNHELTGKVAENFVKLNQLIAGCDVFVSKYVKGDGEKYLNVSLVRYIDENGELELRSVIIEEGGETALAHGIRLRHIRTSLLSKDIYQALIDDYLSIEDLYARVMPTDELDSGWFVIYQKAISNYQATGDEELFDRMLAHFGQDSQMAGEIAQLIEKAKAMVDSLNDAAKLEAYLDDEVDASSEDVRRYAEIIERLCA